VPAPSKRAETKDFVPAQSLRNIAEAISRASGDPIVQAMNSPQILFLIANIIRQEAESLKED
jgi:hypothetical protein